MALRRWAIPLITASTILFGLAGCSGDSSTGSDGDGNLDGDGYLIEAYFGNALVSGGSFSAYVGRLDGSQPSARECQIDVNGTSIPMLSAISTNDDAVFTKLDFGYTADSSYTVTVALDDRIATCSFVAPVYAWPTITSPNDYGDYNAGEPVTITWQYDSGTPDKVYLEAWPENSESDNALYAVELAGSTVSHTIPGSETADWEQYGNILITVDLGEKAWPFAGDLAAIGSFVVTVLPGDALMLSADGSQEQDEWSVYVYLDRSSIEADGHGTVDVTAHVQNQWGSPCPDNTTVTFSLEPDDYGSLDPVTATTSWGDASATFTTGTTTGVVKIYATALDVSNHAQLILSTSTVVEVGTGSHPWISWTPADPMFGLLVREGGLTIGNMEWTVVAGGVNGFDSPVTYGTIPTNGIQAWPLLGMAPDPLEIGTEYTVGLVGASGDTTFHSFTP